MEGGGCQVKVGFWAYGLWGLGEGFGAGEFWGSGDCCLCLFFAAWAEAGVQLATDVQAYVEFL